MAYLKAFASQVKMNRQWVLAIGAGALLSGIALYVTTIVAVPTTTVFATEVPVACLYGSSQACADASARFAVMKQIQPLSWFVAAVGGVLMAYGALQKTDPFDKRVRAFDAEQEPRPFGPQERGEMPRVKQVKQVGIATCGNCNASVREDALRCPSCGAEFIGES